jgi:hypothetical protein
MLLIVSLESRFSVSPNLVDLFNIYGRGTVSANFRASHTMMPKYQTVHYSASEPSLVALVTVGTVLLVAGAVGTAYLIYRGTRFEVKESLFASDTSSDLSPGSGEEGEFDSEVTTVQSSDTLSDTIDECRALEIFSGDEADLDGSSDDGNRPLV